MKVFLSYSYADRIIADRVKEALLEAGYDISDYDENVVNGSAKSKKYLLNVLQEAIRASYIFVAILSENYMKSSWSQAEISFAGMNNMKTLAIVLDDDVTLPSYLSEIAYFKLENKENIDIKKLRETIAYLCAFSGQPNEKPDHAKEDLETKITNLKKALKDNRLTLVCGAGVSIDAGISDWDTLLVTILNKCIFNICKEKSIDINGIDIKDIVKQLSSSSIILAKYLKNSLREDFEAEVKNALYEGEPKESNIINSIVELIRPQRNRGSVESVITFNFDSVLEDALNKNHIKNNAIYKEAMQISTDEIPIYHVHGYLPKGETIETANLVLSEDAYHTQFIEPYSWSNLTQLYKFTNNTCLFLGLSMTDPNLRRLLDIARRKNSENDSKKYIIKKRPIPEDSPINKIELILEEQDANLLGLNVIWVSDFDEIPSVLNMIAT